jgi:hypothetical protein
VTAVRRWAVLSGLLAASLAAAAWVRNSADDADSGIVAAIPAEKGGEPAAGTPQIERNATPSATPPPATQVHLEKLAARSAGTLVRDPFAAPIPPAAKRARSVAKTPAAIPLRRSAPPVPFTYMGKLRSGDDTAVFVTQGDRNLVLHEGDTIDSVYRVEHIADSAITLLYLPLDERQTIPIGEPQ